MCPEHKYCSYKYPTRGTHTQEHIAHSQKLRCGLLQTVTIVTIITVMYIQTKHTQSQVQAHTPEQKARDCTLHGHVLSTDLGTNAKAQGRKNLQACVEAGGGQGPAHLAASPITHLSVAVLTTQDFRS